MQPTLIGITGTKGAGKDTIADLLESEFEYTRYSFADPIKQSLATMFGVPLVWFNDPATKEVPNPLLMGKSPRYLMQTLGTEWGRDLVVSDLWVQLLLRRVEAAQSVGHTYAVVPDVRFNGEALAIKEAGGVIWHVHREAPMYSQDDTHRSEMGIDGTYIDLSIANTGTRFDLFEKVRSIVDHARDSIHRPNQGTSI